ncbi:MAG: carotenoid oxygenase family protein [Candidatus Promineifilaceae bacterium]|nr:carotenoid oxygenase family protein [Candidatus Promineifilaceae bacterium]
MSQQVFELGFNRPAKELAVERLPVQGHIPDWLEGTLLRNGPGTFYAGEQRFRHWFDGLAMLHKFSFGGGQVAYANKFLQSRTYQAVQAQGRIPYSEFATDPCRSLFERVTAVFTPQRTDNAKVSVTKMADRFMALTETPIQVEFDPETLQTVGVYQWEENRLGQMTTVHPHFSADGQTAFNLVTRYGRVSHYRLYAQNGAGPARRLAAVSAAKPSYMHSFGMSANYFILTEFPLVVNPLSLLLRLRPYIENFRWEPKRGTPFYVINRHSGELVGRFEADPFFAFHHVNAFERDGELVVDLVAYPDADIIQAFYLNRLADRDLQLPFGEMRRFRLDLAGGRVRSETLADVCVELPVFDYRHYNTRADYRYVYAVSVDPARPYGFYNQLVKVDVSGGPTRTWAVAGGYPGEPVFVPRPQRQAEDDGVLLSVVLDAAAGHSFLLVLDAASLEEIGRAVIPEPVLFGYHGAYYTEV